jgi:outer membrane protein assembly factor BamB
MRVRAAVGLIALVLGTLAVAGPVRAAGTCAGEAAGGEWRSYGQSLQNQRSQPAETTINAGNARDLTTKFVMTTPDYDPIGGAFSNTPVIADGCLYLATDTGLVIAANADTGEQVWTRKLSGAAPGALVGGVIVGSPTVVNNTVYLGVSRASSPYVAALDQATGNVKWLKTVDTWPSSFINSSPVYFDGMIFQGIAGYEGGPTARGAYAIVEADDANNNGTPGEVIEHHYLISTEEYDAGYRGASIWCSPALDPATGYVYACGGNPASKKIEHRYSNALLKIDMNCGRVAGACTNPTFGDLVDSYKGEYDQYYPGLDRQPACEQTGDDAVYLAWSATCLQLDLDFGASPNLFTDQTGRTVVGALQKSGIFHAVYTDQMSRAWTSVVGAPCFPCNAGSTATDGSSVFAVGTPGGWMMSLTNATGALRWVTPTGGGTHFQPTSVANGIAYTVNNAGILYGMDTSNGLPALVKVLSLDAGANTIDAGSAGVAIARNTVYAMQGEFLVAYHL